VINPRALLLLLVLMVGQAKGKERHTIAPSALVYLFADKFEDLFAAKTRFGTGERVPCREAKVKRIDLATATLTTAFVYLAKRSLINLTVDKKGFIFKKDTVFAIRPPDRPEENLEGLERQISYNITGEKKKDDVQSITHRLLSTYHRDPWNAVINEIKEYLTNQGYFTKESRGGIAKLLGKKTVPQCEKIAGLEPEVQGVREMITNFQTNQPDLYKLLWKNTAAGINSRRLNEDY